MLLLRIPSFIALLIQSLAGLCTICFIFLNSLTIQAHLSIISLCGLQGALAAIFANKWMRDGWWRPIHFVFPFLIYFALGLHLPKELYLVAFLIVSGVFWTCFKTQVPYYPSSKEVWKRVYEELPSSRPLKFVDIGSGLGGLLLHLEKKTQKLTLSGIETAPLPWLISTIRKKLQKSKIEFILGDYNALNFQQYDVIFAYLSPAAMVSLYLKAVMEMRPDTMLISHEFEIPGITPHKVISSPDTESLTFIYLMTDLSAQFSND